MMMTASARRWLLWSQRPSLIAYCFLITVAACAATVAVAFLVPVTAADLPILAGLAFMGIAQAELGRNIERTRRRVIGVGHINMTSVWLLPAVLLLPPVLVGILVTALHWHVKARTRYPTQQVFRAVITISAVALTCYLTRAAVTATGIDGAREAIHAGWAGVGSIIVAISTYFVVNAILVIPALDTHRGLRGVIGTWLDNLLELATLCLGALTAVALAAQPALAVLVVPPLFLLHRAILIDQLEATARQDGKTGVLNITGWHRAAHRELARAKGFVGILMVDLDHFKRINDTHGHLAGDEVLKTVAHTITATVRHRDSVGRFGGEEFLVLLPDLTEPDTRAVAERIRAAVTRLEVPFHDKLITGLSVSIGIATYPTSGTTIERLIQAADTAMYQAKANGRNQVVG